MDTTPACQPSPPCNCTSQSQQEGQACPEEKILREGCRGWRPWADPAPLSGCSCPMRRPAGISCFASLSYSWPSPPLSELDAVIMVSSIILLLKAYRGKPFIRTDCSPLPPSLRAHEGLLHLLSQCPQPPYEGGKTDLYSHFID